MDRRSTQVTDTASTECEQSTAPNRSHSKNRNPDIDINKYEKNYTLYSECRRNKDQDTDSNEREHNYV